VLQTGDPVPSIEARRGSFAQMIQDVIGPLWDGEYQVADVRVADPASTEGVAAVVITGSAANVPDREPWMLRTEAWLREIVGAGVPVFGICFGHQILAQALGGEVIKNPRGREIGTTTIALRARPPLGDASPPLRDGGPTLRPPLGDGGPTLRAHDPIFEGLSNELRANVTHIDTVGRLPPGAVSLASSALDDHQAIRFTETCYGVQFHPEIDGEIMRGYIETRREILAAEGLDPDALWSAVEDGSAGSETLRNFVRRFVRG